MATIVLSAVGASIGGSIGGSVLGVSAAALGQAAGATVGRVIDAQILGAGSSAIETGKIDRFRLTGASEGTPIARVHGRARIAGHVIWSTRFLETATTTGGGKGAPSAPATTSYSYSVSLAIALCEGEITRVGRIWADGNEISKSDLNFRVYRGTEDQLPDPKIEAVEGAGEAPAYRGVAYVVLEDLDLAPFGNRVPQFSFEVMRSGEEDFAETVRAVALIPGTGEYALATTPVTYVKGPGERAPANLHTPSGVTDFETSLDAMSEELPNCGATSLIVSWFGNDLRCGSCEIKPKVEQTVLDGEEMPWVVSGVDRPSAEEVPKVDGRPVYGGTPADASVIEAIQALKDAGQSVMFYPFILMEQLAGNGLPDPWTGALDQPELPWRGRITTSVAPALPGSPDGTALADGEVAGFFGAALASEFSVVGSTVLYTGSDAFTYRRFILHYAHLCVLAGGVESFCIGSEMRSLTQIRGASGFPAVDQLVSLAAEVRAVLGPDTKIGYAADWSEYFGYHPQDGSGDVYFHLDKLWADENVDFIGIDNYMPASDWRDGEGHADEGWGSIYNVEYLKANIAGGEGFDWYYHTPEAEAVQLRTPITDGAYGEPWVYRYKDLKSWWSLPHHDRVAGVRQASPTDWVPESKPLRFTEIGCAAIDKGTNQPNKFLDPKSSESGLPKYSTGARDDLIQMQYLRAIREFWSDPENNPVSQTYGGAMLDVSRMFVWAWDARPYPFFPANGDAWSDGDNYARGHWLNGRVTARSLGAVISETCEASGVFETDVGDLSGLVRGYALEGGETARGALQPLLLAYGLDAIERDGALVFQNRQALAAWALSVDDLARGEGNEIVTAVRSPDAEVSGRVRLAHVEADGDYELRAVEAIFPDEATTSVAQSELPLILTKGEAGAIVERWLAEARVARDRVNFALPPSAALGAGDVVELETDEGGARFRIDRVQDAGLKLVEAVRVEPGVYRSVATEGRFDRPKPLSIPLPVWATMLDLPLLRGSELPASPWIAASARPWPGSVAVYSSIDGTRWSFETLIERAATKGHTLNDLSFATPGLWDRGPSLEVKLAHGALSSIDDLTLFAGGNAAMIGDAETGIWEVFQFRDANLIGPDTWALSHRLRGQRGTDGNMPGIWPTGSTVVVLDGAIEQIGQPAELRGIPIHYRAGPATKPVDHWSFQQFSHTNDGVALRPYAPAHLRAVAQVDGAQSVSWIRRTRIDGDNWVLATVPLGEATEAYTVRVRVGGSVRREEIVTASSWLYSAADQASDGTIAPYSIEVAQNSDLYGPGLFTRIDING